MPWAFQNGVFCAGFYHFYVHDETGPIGTLLRSFNLPQKALGIEDNKVFAMAFISLFMQVIGLLQLPEFLGPTFTPFGGEILAPFLDSSTWNVGKKESKYASRKNAKKAAAAKKNEKSKQS